MLVVRRPKYFAVAVALVMAAGLGSCASKPVMGSSETAIAQSLQRQGKRLCGPPPAEVHLTGHLRGAEEVCLSKGEVHFSWGAIAGPKSHGFTYAPVTFWTTGIGRDCIRHLHGLWFEWRPAGTSPTHPCPTGFTYHDPA